MKQNDKLPFFGIPKLFPFLKRYTSSFVLMFIMATIGSVIDIILPLFQRYAINNFIAQIKLEGSYRAEENAVVLGWAVDGTALPEGEWHWAIFRRRVGENRFKYYMSASKEDRTYIDHSLEPGEDTDYYIRLQFEDGRRSPDSAPVHVSAPKNE